MRCARLVGEGVCESVCSGEARVRYIGKGLVGVQGDCAVRGLSVFGDGEYVTLTGLRVGVAVGVIGQDRDRRGYRLRRGGDIGDGLRAAIEVGALELAAAEREKPEQQR